MDTLDNMDTLCDKIIEWMIAAVVLLIASFFVVAIVSSFVDTGLFQVDHTAQTAEVFTKWVEIKLNK